MVRSSTSPPSPATRRALPWKFGSGGESLASLGCRYLPAELQCQISTSAPVPGALVEIWHCNSAGKYLHPNDASDSPPDPNFHGNARLVAGDGGLVELRTIKPAAYAVPDTDGWWRPPHIHFSVWGRVWLSRLVTQMFFPGDPLNDHDAILNAVRDPEARARCIAKLAPTTQGPARLRESALVYEYQLVVRGRKAA